MIYNWWVERRVRRRITAAFQPAPQTSGSGGQRVEPTLNAAPETPIEPPAGGTPAYRPADTQSPPFTPPMDVIAHEDVPAAEEFAEEEVVPHVVGADVSG